MKKTDIQQSVIGIVSSAFMLLNAMFYSFMIGTVCFFLICFNNIVLLAVALLCGNIVSSVYCLEYQRYRDVTGRPLYPFGYGLTYTTFEYEKISIDKSSVMIDDIKNGEKVKLSMLIRNTGSFDAAETVQCYIRDCKSSMTRPIKELKGFVKLFVRAGESKMAEFEIGFEELGFYNNNGKFVVEPGEFKIYIGKDAWCENNVSLRIKSMC